MGKSDFNVFVCALGFILNYMFMDKLLPECQDKIGPTFCYSLCKTSPSVNLSSLFLSKPFQELLYDTITTVIISGCFLF